MPVELRELKSSAGSWLRAALLVVAATVLCACVEYEQVVTVRSDGTGTIRETTFIKGPMAAMMRSMNAQEESAESTEGSLEMAAGADEEQKARDRAAAFGEGVNFVSWEKISDDDREGGIAVYDFDDVTALRLDTSPPDMEESEPLEPDEEAVEEEADSEDIRFRFDRQGGRRVLVALFDFEEPEPEPAMPEEAVAESPGEEEGEEMAEAVEDMAEGMAEGMAEMMKPMLKGMRMRTVVEIEGEVLESDVPVEGSRVVLMDLDFDAIMANEEGMKKLTLLDDEASMDEVREALSGLPGVVFPATDEVRIVFK